jgi:hypothetical protein
MMMQSPLQIKERKKERKKRGPRVTPLHKQNMAEIHNASCSLLRNGAWQAVTSEALQKDQTDPMIPLSFLLS